MTAIVTPPTIDDLPPAPLPTDTIPDFNSKAFALAAALEDFVDQANASAAATEQNATAANERAASADASADAAALSEAAAAAYAASALNAPGTSAASTTSLTLSAGPKSWTITTGKLFVPGQPVFLARTADPAKVMFGILLTHDNSTGACTANMVPVDGATGTFSDWTMGIGVAPPLAAGAANIIRETRSTNTMLASTDKGKLLNITAGITQTVDAAANLGAGWWVDIGSGDNTTPVVDPNGSETVDGASTLTLPPGWRYRLLCNGTGFTTVVLKRRPIYSLDKLVLVTANTNYIVPPDVYVLRIYAVGAGSAAVAATRCGASGGMAWGDIPVQPGDTVAFAISSGIATVTVNGVVMLTGNAAVTTTAGTASKHASVTNGGTSSGAASTNATDSIAGPSSGSPLGSGIVSVGGGAGQGGTGWGGTGGSSGGGTGGAALSGRGGRAISAVSPSSEPLLSLLAGTPGVSATNGGDGGPGAGGGSGSGGGNIGGRGGIGGGGGANATGTGGDGGFGASGGVGATVNGAAGYGAGGSLDAGGGIEPAGAAAFLYFNPV